MSTAMGSSPPKRLRFRTYLPRDEGLRKLYEKPKDPEEIVQEVMSAQEKMIMECKEKLLVASKDLNKLAPKKANWDLKRDISGKLEKLERRTQRSILELVRQRVGDQEGGNTAKEDTVEGDGTELANAVDQAGEGEEDSDIEF
uniref:Coiled-coil domain-containing protein 12 n=1 Tax=Rhodosorus marinus TaxID=101924 RepID=A0A7S0BL71_9RHOD|mmetsp:Transcript_21585/g.31358  ORF Transcript_21585/g.31358 Transcript_21585/m.31358 type:complete len:143 (+) Transcript_21585:41-469(+)